MHVRPQDASDEDAKQGKAVLKPISELKVGDEVLAWAEWKNPQEAQSYEKVIDIISSRKQQRLVHINLEDGQSITATDGHPFRTTAGWLDAILLKHGDQLQLDTTSGRTVAVQSVLTESKIVPVFNLEVANAHTYFVGAAGVLVHNISVNQMNKQIDTGQAPPGIKRVDPVNTVVPGSQDHVHFDDGTSLNRDGSIHDEHRGKPKPTNQQKKWLRKCGWKI